MVTCLLRGALVPDLERHSTVRDRSLRSNQKYLTQRRRNSFVKLPHARCWLSVDVCWV